jgi:hypothetical protein
MLFSLVRSQVQCQAQFLEQEEKEQGTRNKRTRNKKEEEEEEEEERREGEEEVEEERSFMAMVCENPATIKAPAHKP